MRARSTPRHTDRQDALDDEGARRHQLLPAIDGDTLLVGAGTTGLHKKPRFQLIAYSIQGASARTEPQAHASTTKRQVSGKEFSFKLSSKSIAKPGRVAFNFRNVGHLAHNFKVNGKHTPDVQPAKTAKLVVNFRKKGEYRDICTEPGHAAAGMNGVFTVR